MHRRNTRQPGYLHHKPSNQAYVRIDVQMIYLGVYDTAESHRRYAATTADAAKGLDDCPPTVGIQDHYCLVRPR